MKIPYNDPSEFMDTIPFNPYYISHVNLYKPSVEQMVSMGFGNRDRNLECLQRCHGDIQDAVSLLLDTQ